MNYENYNKIVGLVQECENLKKKLREFEEPYLEVKVIWGNTTISTIDISSTEHSFAKNADDFVKSVQKTISDRIKKIEEELKYL